MEKEGKKFARGECVLKARYDTQVQIASFLEDWHEARDVISAPGKLPDVGALPSDSNYFVNVPNEGQRSYEQGQMIEFWVDGVKCREQTELKTFDGFTRLEITLESQPTPVPEPGTLQEALQQAKDAIDRAIELSDGGTGRPFAYPPHKVFSKLWPGSWHFYGELITPYAAAVQMEANTIRHFEGEALVEAAFKKVYEGSINYAYDVAVHGFDHWSLPAVTLARRIGDCEDKSNLFVSIMIACGWPREAVFAAGWQVNTPSGPAGHEWAVVKHDGEWYVVECTANDWHGLITYEDAKESLGVEYVESFRFNDMMAEER